MRVIFVSDHFSTPGEPGILRTWQLARHLCEAGDTVTVIAPETHYLFGNRPSENSQALLPSGLTVVRTKSPGLRRESVSSRLLYYLAQLVGSSVKAWRAGQCDVLVAGLTPSVLALGPFVVSRLRRVPFVLDERDLALDAAAELGILPKPVITVARVFERLLHRGSDAVIAVTPGLRRMLVEAGVDSERLWLVPNGYEGSAGGTPSGRAVVRHSLGWDDKVILLYAGGLGRAYDLDVVLDAMSEFRGEAIVLAIMGEGEKKDHYRARADAEGLPVQFLATRAKNEVPTICHAADICVLPLRPVKWSVCSLSNKLFDYMGAGAPVIATGPGDTADLVAEARAGLVVPAGDCRAMSTAVRRLIDQPVERKAMGQAGQRFVSLHWRREHFTEEFRRALESVLAPSPGRRSLELQRIRNAYALYDGSSKEQAKRAMTNPGTAAMVDRRWRALQRALINVPTQDAPRLLDVGCGSGADLQRIGDFWANRKPVLYGIDMLPQRIHLARVALPEAKLVVGSADKLPFPEKFFDVVLVSTLFSSILNRNLAESIARELMRVARPGGTVIVYDVRLPNLTNPNTRSVSQRSLRRLFPNTSLSTESLTLLPPLARRLGSRAPKLYGPMERVPFLRSHNLALIRIGCPEVGSLAESIQ